MAMRRALVLPEGHLARMIPCWLLSGEAVRRPAMEKMAGSPGGTRASTHSGRRSARSGRVSGVVASIQPAVRLVRCAENRRSWFTAAVAARIRYG